MTATAAPAPPRIAWLAALAVGLAHSARSDAACVSELLGSGRGRVEDLEAAIERLEGLPTVDSEVRGRAGRLLGEARRIARAHPSNAHVLRPAG